MPNEAFPTKNTFIHRVDVNLEENESLVDSVIDKALLNMDAFFDVDLLPKAIAAMGLAQEQILSAPDLVDLLRHPGKNRQ